MTTRIAGPAITLLACLAACGSPRIALDGDYLDPDLRADVEQLKADVAAQPTDDATIAGRARILADWVDAYSLSGNEVGLEGSRVRRRKAHGNLCR